MSDTHVVVMFEYNAPWEKLDSKEQVNEVFGPFSNGDEANDWCEKAENLIKNRHWLVIPLSEPCGIMGPEAN